MITGVTVAEVEDVEDGDGDEDGGEETAEVSCLPVLHHDDEEEDVESEGEGGEDGPAGPPPGGPRHHLLSQYRALTKLHWTPPVSRPSRSRAGGRHRWLPSRPSYNWSAITRPTVRRFHVFTYLPHAMITLQPRIEY